jgi:squalene monooxygenase
MDTKAADGSIDHPFDILIVGAGVVGSAAAVAFARQGRNVLLLERSLKEPDRIVGELLQPGGVAALERLGLGSCLDGIDAIPVRGYDIFYRGERITFFYPPVQVIELGKTKRRPEGRSFHHGKFVMKLREVAGSEGKIRIVETSAKELHTQEGTGRVIGVKCVAADRFEQNVSCLHFRCGC